MKKIFLFFCAILLLGSKTLADVSVEDGGTYIVEFGDKQVFYEGENATGKKILVVDDWWAMTIHGINLGSGPSSDIRHAWFWEHAYSNFRFRFEAVKENGVALENQFYIKTAAGFYAYAPSAGPGLEFSETPVPEAKMLLTVDNDKFRISPVAAPTTYLKYTSTSNAYFELSTSVSGHYDFTLTKTDPLPITKFPAAESQNNLPDTEIKVCFEVEDDFELLNTAGITVKNESGVDIEGINIYKDYQDWTWDSNYNNKHTYVLIENAPVLVITGKLETNNYTVTVPAGSISSYNRDITWTFSVNSGARPLSTLPTSASAEDKARAIASDSLSASYAAWRAFDGKDNGDANRWISTVDAYEHWVAIDLGAEYIVTEINVVRDLQMSNYPNSHFIIQTGTKTDEIGEVTWTNGPNGIDGVTWVDQLSVTTGNEYKNVARVNVPVADATARYVRYYVPAETGNQTRIFEVTVLGKSVPAEPVTFIWSGSGTTNWYTKTNWESTNNSVPTFRDNIIIPQNDENNYPVLTEAGPVNVNSITFEPGAELGGQQYLNVTGTVHVRKTFTPQTWYPMGFPFELSGIRGDFKEYPDLYIYDPDENWGDFWVKSYNGNIFEYSTKIVANTGYILQFPTAFDGVEVTFSSIESPKLKNADENDLDLTDETYTLLVNPSVKNLTVGTVSGNNYYIYDRATNNFALLASGATATIKSFESFVAVKNIVPAKLRSSLNVEEVGDPTGLKQITDDTKDPVIKTQYYTLQGMEIDKPQSNGVYIVKKVRASQKVETTKIIHQKENKINYQK
jgi:hypothetical protein